MIEGFSYFPYGKRLLRLGLWTLEERRNRCDLIEVFINVLRLHRDRHKDKGLHVAMVRKFVNQDLIRILENIFFLKSSH